MATLLFFLVGTVVGGVSMVPHAGAASLAPTCVASQITVTAGATRANVPYRQVTAKGTVSAVATEAVPVYFHNSGSACRLLKDAPSFRAVRRVSNPAMATAGDLALTVLAGTSTRVTVAAKATVEAYYIVVKPTRVPAKLCRPDATTGFEVGAFAAKSRHVTFIARRVRFVCFDSGTRSRIVNDGVVWVSPS